ASLISKGDMDAARFRRVVSTEDPCSRMVSTSGWREAEPDPESAEASPSSPAVSASMSAWLSGPSSAIFPYFPIDYRGYLNAFVAPHYADLAQEFGLVPDLDHQVALGQFVQ